MLNWIIKLIAKNIIKNEDFCNIIKKYTSENVSAVIKYAFDGTLDPFIVNTYYKTWDINCIKQTIELIVNEQVKKEIKTNSQDILKSINTEEFIDKLISRIKIKQLN